MICCWIAADCGFPFTCRTAWVTVAKPTRKLFADYSTYWWVFQSAVLCTGKRLGRGVDHVFMMSVSDTYDSKGASECHDTNLLFMIFFLTIFTFYLEITVINVSIQKRQVFFRYLQKPRSTIGVEDFCV